MVPAPFIVLLDANVLFPFSLRDTLLRAAAAGFYQVRWSSQILDEMARNLVSTGTMPEEKAQRLRAIMEREFPEAEVTDYEHLIAAMKNHEKDRHVAAAEPPTQAARSARARWAELRARYIRRAARTGAQIPTLPTR
ncbi:MAG: PIN domain-containing protein [Deltaproteobacteria bacterium]|nr:MAG: PIN domain-containing protein [Deltaproteobacteria bacterium]TMQ14216.1 MAG: PIN domain-containing protein [Deltaproteobacteria bacterium]